MGNVKKRDYLKEMGERIDNAIPSYSDWVPAIVAQELSEEIWQQDPDLFVGFLTLKATELIRTEITSRSRRRRARLRANHVATVFQEAVKEYEQTGDKKVFDVFDLTFEVDNEHTRRRLGDMVGSDHLWVASRYHLSANKQLLLAAFHKAVADQIGVRRTSDVYSEEQLIRQYKSITGM